jgi:ubiquinone/menaquinone biosynthesis C-methylase UbiE
MDIEDLIAVNRLWHKIYPYTARQVMASFGRQNGRVLELGSFAGGISFVLAAEYPALELTIAADDEAYLDYLETELERRGLKERIRLIKTSMTRMPFKTGAFDLIILRGAFFFIMDEPDILSEIHRLLTPGGLAFVGGGYGKDVPDALIDEIADESRLLNDKLGRRRISVAELRTLLESRGLGEKTQIIEEGGVWLEIRARATT